MIKRIFSKISIHAVLILVSLLSIFPFVWLISTSLKGASENIFAYVHKGNSASKGAFFKSGYQVYYKSAFQSSVKNSEFHILYTTPRNKIYTSDEKDL